MKLLNILTPCYCSASQTIAEKELEETGFDRVKRIFQKTEYGFMSPELFYLINGCYTSVAVSAILGAFISANQARDDYLRKNVASLYESQHLAKRHLSDSMSLAAFKGGFRYASKYGTFSSLYLLSTMTIANYNNKITIWEHIGTAAVLGGLARLRFGLKGMAVSACTAGVLGAFGGGIFVLSLWLTGMTLEDVREAQKHAYYDKRKKRVESINPEKSKEEFILQNYAKKE